MYMIKKCFQGLTICGLATAVLLSSCNDKKGSSNNTIPAETKPAESKGTTPTGKIAYVDMDTLEANYTYLKEKRAELERETKSFDAEIGGMTQKLQNEYMALQKKAKEGTMTQTEGQEAEKRLGQMQQNIEARKQTLGDQIMKKQQAFNKDLQARLDAYLVKYNADKGYDYILSYTKGGPIMFANKSLNITDDVIKGMNAESGSTSEAK